MNIVLSLLGLQKDKNITYEEANKKYNDGITWKKTAHEKFGTQLLVTIKC